MRAIFISYRRDDSEGQSGRLYDDLVRRFGENTVFMDVVGIEPGRDFRKVIDTNVASCGVLLAVIGPSWLEAKDENGMRRLDNPMDFVRLETAAALKRDIPVVPVLVRGARMPREEQLPDDLKEFAYRNGLELTHARWDSDVEVLIKALKRHVSEGSEPVVASTAEGAAVAPAPKPVPAPVPEDVRRPRPWMLRVVAAAVVVAAAAGIIYFSGHSRKNPAGQAGLVQPVISVFSVTPTEITRGGEVRIHWEVQKADEVRIEPFGLVSPAGDQVVQPQATTIYRITATNRSGGKAGTFQEVIVRGPVSQPALPPARSGPAHESPASQLTKKSKTSSQSSSPSSQAPNSASGSCSPTYPTPRDPNTEKGRVLYISSSSPGVEGAQVYLDGRCQGAIGQRAGWNGPGGYLMVIVPPGRYQVSVKKDGFRDFQSTVEAPASALPMNSTPKVLVHFDLVSSSSRDQAVAEKAAADKAAAEKADAEKVASLHARLTVRSKDCVALDSARYKVEMSGIAFAPAGQTYSFGASVMSEKAGYFAGLSCASWSAGQAGYGRHWQSECLHRPNDPPETTWSVTFTFYSPNGQPPPNKAGFGLEQSGGSDAARQIIDLTCH